MKEKRPLKILQRVLKHKRKLKDDSSDKKNTKSQEPNSNDDSNHVSTSTKKKKTERPSKESTLQTILDEEVEKVLGVFDITNCLQQTCPRFPQHFQ